MAQRKGLSFHTWQTLRDLFILVLHILLETVRIFNIFNIVYYKGIVFDSLCLESKNISQQAINRYSLPL